MPLMPKESIWVEMLGKLYPKANQKELCERAFALMRNMMDALKHEIAREDKIHRETAQKWKDALRGR
ncbi:MAG TPA: hypothetical protein VFU89_01705 [Rhabdochlamydiaceae bacterium]|nr:hypothetical protein [Rhabdochlamydiaceae bacterium]